MPTAVRIHHEQVNRVAAHVENAQSHPFNLAGTDTISREVAQSIIGYRYYS
jgi:hypothetical protein